MANQFSRLQLSDGSTVKARIVGWYDYAGGLEFEFESGEHIVVTLHHDGTYSITPLKNGIPDFASLGLGEEQ